MLSSSSVMSRGVPKVVSVVNSDRRRCGRRSTGHRKFKGPGQGPRPRRAFDGLKCLDWTPVPSRRAVAAVPWTVHQGAGGQVLRVDLDSDGVAPKRRASPPRLRSWVAALGRGVCDGRCGSRRGSGCEILSRLTRPPSTWWLRIQAQVSQDLLDHRPLQDRCDELELAAAVRAALQLEVEHVADSRDVRIAN